MMLFVLISVGLVGMIHTHNNVIGLGLDSQPAKAVFLGETATFPIRIHNDSNKFRQAVWLLCDGFHQLLDLPEGDHRQILLRLPTVQRGYLNCSNINLSSQFPLGLFFCWTKRYQTAQRCIVYPQPLNLIPFPDSSDNSVSRPSNSRSSSNAEDYSGMKDYQAGDRLRDIHWPSLAKTHKLVSIQHEDQSSSSVNLSWFSMPAHLSTEDRLSQLCYWVIEAEKSGLRYQLEMPNHTLEFDRGNAHYHACLSVLALWDTAE